MPLQIRSTVGSAPGTLVTDGLNGPGEALPREAPARADRPVRAIAHVGPRSRVWAVPARGEFDGEEIHQLFQSVAEAGVSVDMIYVAPDRLSFVVDEELGDQVREVLTRRGARFEVTSGFAKVSCVGAGMHGLPGVMARIARALAEAGVRIYHTVDSHANISCLVRQEEVGTAVRALSREFGLLESGSGGLR